MIKFWEVGALNSDVIYHEATHAVIHDIFGHFITGTSKYYPEAGRYGNEGLAMSVAFPDFFACTKNGNSVVFDGLTIQRDIGPDKKFAEDMYSDYYKSSLIMSGTCWDLRAYIGASDVNELIFDAINIMSTVHAHPYYFEEYLDCLYLATSDPSIEYGIWRAFTRDHEIERTMSKPLAPPEFEPHQSLEEAELPQNYCLFQNYPNPFNSNTTIRYEIPELSLNNSIYVILKIYNLNGQLIRTLENAQKAPGKYQAQWDGENETGSPVTSGIYFVQIKTREFVSWMKIILAR